MQDIRMRTVTYYGGNTHSMICDHVGADEDEHDVDDEPDERWQQQAHHAATILRY